jgi:hypothetical protein
VQEKFEKIITRSFNDVQDAIDFLGLNSTIKLDDLAPCKGQKIFNPRFDENLS